MFGLPRRVFLCGTVCALAMTVGLAMWAATTDSSGAQAGLMHNCPSAGMWSMPVWDGADGTAAADALATCGAGAVDAAYALDAQTGVWSRWFAGKPDVSNLPPLNDMTGVLALGGAAATAAGDTLALAQAEGELHNCPPAGMWSIAVWDGADGTAAADALATCGAGAVDAAYALDAQTGSWFRWFAAKPEVSNLPPLADMAGVVALGSATGPAATPTVTASPAVTPSATATIYVPPPPSVRLCIYEPRIPSIWPWGDRFAEVQAFADELESEYELAIQTAALDSTASGSCNASGVGDFWNVDCHSSKGPDLRCDIWYWSEDWADVDCDEDWFADDLKQAQLEAVGDILTEDPDILSCAVSGVGSFLHVGCFTVDGGHFTCDATYIGSCANMTCRVGY